MRSLDRAEVKRRLHLCKGFFKKNRMKKRDLEAIVQILLTFVRFNLAWILVIQFCAVFICLKSFWKQEPSAPFRFAQRSNVEMSPCFRGASLLTGSSYALLCTGLVPVPTCVQACIGPCFRGASLLTGSCYALLCTGRVPVPTCVQACIG